MAGMNGPTLTPSLMWEISVRRLRRLEEYSITRYRGFGAEVAVLATWSSLAGLEFGACYLDSSFARFRLTS